MGFTCTFTTPFQVLSFAGFCQVSQLVAIVALDEKILWCESCSFVAQFVDEKAIPDAMVGAYCIVSEYYDGVVFSACLSLGVTSLVS